MTTDATASAPPAPTSLELPEQVTIHDRNEGTRVVAGRTVAPGLIVTAAHDHNKEQIPRLQAGHRRMAPVVRVLTRAT